MVSAACAQRSRAVTSKAVSGRSRLSVSEIGERARDLVYSSAGFVGGRLEGGFTAGWGHLCVPIHIGERIRVDRQHLERALADADAVLDQQVDELVAVNERDRRGAAGEGGFLRALREA